MGIPGVRVQKCNPTTIGNYGVIVIDRVRMKINAGCWKEGHAKCHFDKTVMPSDLAHRRGQGRPIGLLLSWLFYGPSCLAGRCKHEDAKDDETCSYDERKRARNWGLTHGPAALIEAYGFEAQSHLGHDIEPPTIPRK